ncbi:putative porin [Bacteroides sp. 519]|uniref:putative porin n=1 Tax=Bacteroides sp. 519 TaxID=2302937 RepID=UPI0013D4B481|nr:putative porin [Bacteroides sp. 519]NDV59697.1 hypothetical protein [Bacteroides sp. 519]
MKRIRLTYLLLFSICQLVVLAQTPNQRPLNSMDPQMDPSMRATDPDSLNNKVEIISLPPRLYMWKISEELGNIIPLPVDTVHLQFQNSNLAAGVNGEYSHLGNIGTPRLSRIFFNRPLSSLSPFLSLYDEFLTLPHQHIFTNSNIPYTNLSYYKAGGKIDGQERFKSYFSVNVNKALAFGFNFDYLYGRGFYNHQQTAHLKAGLFGSYVGDKYRAHIVFNSFNMKMAENGGITDDRYITDPELMANGGREYTGRDIPTNLSSTWNYNNHFYVYLTHRYNLGFYRDAISPVNENDTIEEFVPVTSFIHTAKVERSKHKFISEGEADFFPEKIINWGSNNTKDTTTYIGVKNTFGIALLEGFNKYAKAGLTAYISHKYNRYQLMDKDSITKNIYTEQEVFVGGELSKRAGTLLHYNAIGEIGLAGEAIGQFRVTGNADLNLRLGRDTVNLIARGSVTNLLPAFYMRHYHSNHYWWDNEDMDKEFRTKLEGELNIRRWGTNIKAGVENIKNYTYFNNLAKPAQFADNIQVFSAQLNQKLNLGILHFDNEVTYQKTSNKNILPLPELSLYSNLYLDAKLAKKVLSLQLGVDMRYFSKYYAPVYAPGIQQFHLQTNNADEQVQIGGYPIINVYANFHLKRTRFFVMMTHINQGMGDENSFLIPHYPINQRLLRLGLSWNFYD